MPGNVKADGGGIRVLVWRFTGLRSVIVRRLSLLLGCVVFFREKSASRGYIRDLDRLSDCLGVALSDS